MESRDEFSGNEVAVQATQYVIDALAERIEKAYRIRRSGWRGNCSSPRVWSVVAGMLFRAQENDRKLPLDPELFVASQSCDSSFPDPWVELTHENAIENYRANINKIVGWLVDELSDEVRHAEGKILQGEPIARVLLSRVRRVSPLGRYIVAYRAGRPNLANRFRKTAWDQHRSCPLYRQASADFLPEALYPSPLPGDLAPVTPRMQSTSRPREQIFLN